MTDLQKLLTRLSACKEAVEWVGERDLPTAWAECERADWMLWLAGNMAGKNGWSKRKDVILAAIECGRLSLANAGEYRDQLSAVFDVAEKCAKDPTPENIDAARSAGSAAGSAESAAWSAWSAGDAARSAAGYAGSAAGYAEYAAGSARSAAWSAGDAAHKKMCSIIRKELLIGGICD